MTSSAFINHKPERNTEGLRLRIPMIKNRAKYEQQEPKRLSHLLPDYFLTFRSA